MKRILIIVVAIIPFLAAGQGAVKWTTDGNGYYELEAG
jgi:hypothetical protein